jgi:hypothetical protein
MKKIASKGKQVKRVVVDKNRVSTDTASVTGRAYF